MYLWLIRWFGGSSVFRIKGGAMKVLWICNIVLPELCDVFGFRRTNVGGWITGLWEELKKKDIELAIAVPIHNKERMMDGEFDGYQFYSFAMSQNAEVSYEQEECFSKVIDLFEPDVIHIWGTEYVHTYSVLRVCQRKNILYKTVINIQGLVSVCHEHYGYGLPKEVIESSQIQVEKRSFFQRGELEKKSLQMGRYVLGRTCWDKASTYLISPQIEYCQCGEILRRVFYQQERKWNLESCRKHSIFVSQASYPVKGFHLVLENICNLAKRYKDLVVYVAGTDITKTDSEYANYVKFLIKKYKLEDVIKFIGLLTEEEMYEQYLKTHVFLSASTIENSPNSVCEAMMVGVPVVASGVGGIFSIIEHEKNGYIYPLDEPYIMEYYVSKIFEGGEELKKISNNAIKTIQKYNDKDNVVNTVLNIYEKIVDVEIKELRENKEG